MRGAGALIVVVAALALILALEWSSVQPYAAVSSTDVGAEDVTVGPVAFESTSNVDDGSAADDGFGHNDAAGDAEDAEPPPVSPEGDQQHLPNATHDAQIAASDAAAASVVDRVGDLTTVPVMLVASPQLAAPSTSVANLSVVDTVRSAPVPCGYRTTVKLGRSKAAGGMFGFPSAARDLNERRFVTPVSPLPPTRATPVEPTTPAASFVVPSELGLDGRDAPVDVALEDDLEHLAALPTPVLFVGDSHVRDLHDRACHGYHLVEEGSTGSGKHKTYVQRRGAYTMLNRQIFNKKSKNAVNKKHRSSDCYALNGTLLQRFVWRNRATGVGDAGFVWHHAVRAGDQVVPVPHNQRGATNPGHASNDPRAFWKFDERATGNITDFKAIIVGRGGWDLRESASGFRLTPSAIIVTLGEFLRSMAAAFPGVPIVLLMPQWMHGQKYWVLRNDTRGFGVTARAYAAANAAAPAPTASPSPAPVPRWFGRHLSASDDGEWEIYAAATAIVSARAFALNSTGVPIGGDPRSPYPTGRTFVRQNCETLNRQIVLRQSLLCALRNAADTTVPPKSKPRPAAAAAHAVPAVFAVADLWPVSATNDSAYHALMDGHHYRNRTLLLLGRTVAAAIHRSRNPPTAAAGSDPSLSPPAAAALLPLLPPLDAAFLATVATPATCTRVSALGMLPCSGQCQPFHYRPVPAWRDDCRYFTYPSCPAWWAVNYTGSADALNVWKKKKPRRGRG